MQNTPTIEQAKQYIDNIDFSMVIDKIVRTKKWKKRDVEKICEQYRHFLFLNKKYCTTPDQALAPSEEIDEFWHNHILDTKKYRADCEKIFGYYADHYPYVGMDGKTTREDSESAFARTQQLHFNEFGDYIFTVRNVRVHQIISFCQLLIKQLRKRLQEKN